MGVCLCVRPQGAEGSGYFRSQVENHEALDFGRNGIRLSGLGHRGFGGSLPMRFAFWGKP